MEYLKPYITGKQKITYIDSGITITEKTKNLYAVALVFIFPDVKTTWFYATGKIKYGDPSRVGADRVNWGFENEESITTHPLAKLAFWITM